MSKKYFPNRGSECYCSALANLLIELGDEQTAQEVFDTYQYNRLVSKDGGMHAGLATRALSELTHSRYEGILTANFSANFEGEVRRGFPEEAETIITVMKEERERGRIKSHTGIIDLSSLVLPALFYINLWHDPHFNVYLGNGLFIDNGVRGYPAVKHLDVPAVLEVRKN